MSKICSGVTISAIIVAAGNSQRMGKGVNKQLLLIDEIPILAHTLINFDKATLVDNIIIVTRQEDILLINDLVREFGVTKVKSIIPGGATRQQSVMNGLSEASGSDFVAVHDGARPFATPSMIDNTIKAAIKYGAAAPGVIPKDTIKISDADGYIKSTPPRETLRLIQTPQVFHTDELQLSYIRAKETGFEGTDDCSLAENMGISIFITDGAYTNIKVTTPEDLPLAETIYSHLKK